MVCSFAFFGAFFVNLFFFIDIHTWIHQHFSSFFSAVN